MSDLPSSVAIDNALILGPWRNCWNDCDGSDNLGSESYDTQVVFYGWSGQQCVCLSGDQWGAQVAKMPIIMSCRIRDGRKNH